MTFESLGIIDRILKSVVLAGYKEPTPIQVDAIPVLLEKKDLLGSAQTGTGKTAAFAIPILQNIFQNNDLTKVRQIEALVLTPTRELATQIAENFTIYSKYLNIKNTTVFGGVSQKKQEEALRKGVDVLIATPGRLQDLMNQGIISLNHVKYLVLDEADQMLDMGFIKDVKNILKVIPTDRQTMLFSATMPKSIELLAKEILKDPVRIAITPVTKTLDLINQTVYHVAKKQKTKLLVQLIHEMNMTSVLVFTRTKHNANRVVKELALENVVAEPIHGNKSQQARERALSNLKSGKTKILVATDIAARGIDIEALDYVFNYDLPQVPETYIHRIGRTGRAGLSGKTIAFCDPAEMKLLQDIEKHIQTKIKVIQHDFVGQDIKTVVVESTKISSKKTGKDGKKIDTKYPDYLKFRNYKKKDEKKNSSSDSKKDGKVKSGKTGSTAFEKYQKKKNPYYQTKSK